MNDDRALLAATTAAFLAEHAPLSATRALADDPTGFDAHTWAKGCELGWTSPLVDAADGGGSVSGDGLADLVAIAGEFGRVVAPGPLIATNVAAAAIGAHRDDARRAALLAPLIDGSVTAAAFAPGPGPEPVPALDARSDGDGFVVTGSIQPVENAAAAGIVVSVAACESAGPVVFALATDTPGLTVTPLGGLDLVRRHGRIDFAEVHIPTAAVIATGARAEAVARRMVAIAGVLQCAESAGAMARMFEVTRAYLADRYSFGRPLASYQALKHRIADDALALQRCHATTGAAAAAVARGDADADELVSVAKAFVGLTATECIQDFVQLHGGIGVTWESDLHLYLRRTTVNRMTWGTPDEHAERVADAAFGGAP
ncbi:MAG: acyl-CoA dehydrogenase [Actinobacteria bacterium]|nr:acyl-CoA dehydrogenase [Actinomycetota bacterium]